MVAAFIQVIRLAIYCTYNAQPLC